MFALTFQSFTISSCFLFMVQYANVYLCFWSIGSVLSLWQVIGEILRVIYIISFISMPEAIKSMHGLFAILFAIIMAFMLFSGGYAQVWSHLARCPISETWRLLSFQRMGCTRLAPFYIWIPGIFHFAASIHPHDSVVCEYSVCNIHDISWGTKGLDEASSHNHVTTSVDKTGQHTAVVDLPSPNDDADAYYLRELEKLKHLSVMLKKNIYQMKRKTDRYEKSYDGE
ncbi:hypothetical protein BCR33DRAFT_713961 [Rhizoclosmatium globosum]|uniref:Uncharacterized protein n=1 Tax=Rhizoclosmatium globosum TaxID=329046 RepID=A0A1Y2CR66_9FUNG|nr:hypothetical protein BCR33DRAFT_713961 [Rhizoclosmatium globosum]|eukprot:ORY48845.1 hypothetical protein BCR33DRAFT_713961 [Rhizoclosmatium globosum]